MILHLGKFARQPPALRQRGAVAAQADAGACMRFVRLVIVESGSTGLAARATVDDGLPVVAIAQGDGEWAGSFAHRVVRRILAIEMAEQSIERTVLFLGARSELDAVQARLTIARALITHSAAALGRPPELVLDTSGESHAELQREIPALMDALMGSAAVGAPGAAVKLVHRSRADGDASG